MLLGLLSSRIRMNKIHLPVSHSIWHSIISSSIVLSACQVLSWTSPLFEEERNPSLVTLN